MLKELKKKAESMLNYMIGILVLCIIAIGAVVPTVQSLINNASITGTGAILLPIIPVLILILVVVAIARGME